MAEKKKKKGTFALVLGILLILAALGLTVYNQWDADRAEKASLEVVEELEALIAANEGNNTEVGGIYLDPNAQMGTINIRGHEYIGTIRIPELGLKLPVMADWDYTKLKIAPCRYNGSYYTDDLVIAGHNYAKHFSKIKGIKPGADVYFTNVDGLTLHYQVDNIENLKPTQVETLITGDWSLTMFTCNTGGRTRCVVRCARIE